MKVKAVPIEGKANKEILKFFQSALGVEAEIIRGEKSKFKVLKLISPDKTSEDFIINLKELVYSLDFSSVFSSEFSCNILNIIFSIEGMK